MFSLNDDLGYPRHLEKERENTGRLVRNNQYVNICDRRFQSPKAAPEMRFIGLTATGTDNVDLVAAKERGIAVCNIRAYCTQSVAEHVFGCLLSLAHSLGPYAADVRKGAWQEADNFCMLTHPIQELSAMTLGVVGHGVSVYFGDYRVQKLYERERAAGR